MMQGSQISLRLGFVCVSSALFVLGCATTSRPPAASAPLHTLVAEIAPRAFVTPDSAVFVFPGATPNRFDPLLSAGTARRRMGGFVWAVQWIDVPLSDTTFYGAPGVIAWADSLSSSPEGRHTLETVVAAATCARTEYRASEPPGMSVHQDSALTASVRDGQVVLTLRGRAALERTWRTRPPNAARFYWRVPGQPPNVRQVILQRRP